jgi:hypothetical protein
MTHDNIVGADIIRPFFMPIFANDIVITLFAGGGTPPLQANG